MLDKVCPGGKYVDGWSDDACSRELKIDRGQVEKIRLEIFGNDPRVEELKHAIETVKQKVENDLKELRELEKSIRDDFARQLDGLSDRLAAIEAG